MSKSNEYWIKRFEDLQNASLDKGSKLCLELEKQYTIAYKEIEKEILQWYKRFAKDNKITFVEAKKILTAGELQEFKWTLEEYIDNASKASRIWAKELENASIRVHISRLDSLRIQIQNEIEKIYGKQLEGMTEVAELIYTDNYFHTAYELQKGNNIAWKLESIGSKTIDKVLSTAWADDATFSDKIWKNKQSLLSTLTTVITQNMIRGKSPDDAIENIAKKFNTDLYKAGRLVMTESAFFAAESQKECFKDLWVDKYKVLGTLDVSTCSECGDMDLKEFKMKDYQSGITAPPFHPFCRCTTIPAFDNDYEFGERAARNMDGKTYFIPNNISYKQWKEQYVNTNPKEKQRFETRVKMNKNKAGDIKQYTKYKEILGKDIPKTFAEFQDIKYNNVSEWKNLKAQYSDTLGITTKEKAKEYINNVNKKINDGKQDKHILGSNNYITGRSYLTISKEEAQELVDKYAGTGNLKFADTGKWAKQEVIYTNKEIGIVKSKQGEYRTTDFKIHYSKNGTHIVPFRKG